VIGEATAALAVASHVDLAGETARVAKEIAGLQGDIDRATRKLANPDFIARAPPEVIEENRDRLAEAQGAKARLEAARARLEALA
jgi:valyl-tRNA synthetase